MRFKKHGSHFSAAKHSGFLQYTTPCPKPYSLKDMSKPIGVSAYQITSNMLENWNASCRP